MVARTVFKPFCVKYSMPMGLSQRAAGIKESPTFAISTKAKRMKSEGIDMIDFGIGQPMDFEPPEVLKVAVTESLHQPGIGRYIHPAGLPELREALCNKLKRDNGIDYKTEQVMVTSGGKHALYNIMQSILDPGDEVIVPVPYWVSYPDMITLACGKQVNVETDENFNLTADQIAEKLTNRTKAIIINSPNNPSGAMMHESELKRIADLAVENRVYVISDECYEAFVYDGEMVSIASLNDEIKQNTFTVNTMSKTYAIPGWRLGYVAGPEDVINAMTAIQSNSTSNITSLLQPAAAKSLLGLQDNISRMREVFRERRDAMVAGLNDMGLKCPMPQGAFYAFPRLPEGQKNSIKFATELLEKRHVAVIPGSAFGRDGHVRISYADSMEMIEEGLDRLRKFVL